MVAKPCLLDNRPTIGQDAAIRVLTCCVQLCERLHDAAKTVISSQGSRSVKLCCAVSTCSLRADRHSSKRLVSNSNVCVQCPRIGEVAVQ